MGWSDGKEVMHSRKKGQVSRKCLTNILARVSMYTFNQDDKQTCVIKVNCILFIICISTVSIYFSCSIKFSHDIDTFQSLSFRDSLLQLEPCQVH